MRYPRRGALGFLAVLVAWAAFAPAAVAATSPGSVVTISFGEGVASAATAGSSPQIAGKVASIGFVADLHAGCTAWLPDQLSAFRDHLQGLGLDDVIFAGDILNNDVDQVTFLETYNASFSGAMALSAPHYELNGNHDEPMHPFLNSFTLDAGSLRFIGFVMNYVVTDLGTFGSMTQDMIDSVDARLAAAVAAGKTPVLVSHVPILDTGSQCLLPGQGQEQMLTLCQKYGVVAALSGHNHTRAGSLEIVNGTAFYSAMAAVEWAGGYEVIDIYPTRIEIRGYNARNPFEARWNGPYISPPPTRYDQTNAKIVKVGAWSDFSKTAAYSGSYGRSSTASASTTVYFTGTRLDWIAIKGLTTGMADVYVDDVKMTATPINLYAAAAVYQVNVWSTGDLPAGAHKVRMVRSAASAAGRYLTLDAVDIWGQLTAAPPPVTRYDQTNTNIVKIGGWSDFTKTAAYSGSYGRSSTDGASATVYFRGTRLDWIATKGLTTCLADVYVDDVKMTGTPINLYANPAIYKVNVWSTGYLPTGPHKVQIVRSAGSAAGTFLTLDAVDVWGQVTSGP